MSSPSYNLISDTFTTPCKSMLESLLSIEYGDQGYEEDQITTDLERRMADKFQMDSACFTLSGTASNLLALVSQAPFGTSVLCSANSDLNLWESCSISAFGGLRLNSIDSNEILPRFTSLIPTFSNNYFGQVSAISGISLEIPHVLLGGKYPTIDELSSYTSEIRSKGLFVHIDGARLYNLIATNYYDPRDVGKCCNTISLCFSKTLGAPMGSILIGKHEVIEKARYFRKMIGGTVRQAALSSKLCHLALDNSEHTVNKALANANTLEYILKRYNYKILERPLLSNIILLPLHQNTNNFIDHLKHHKIRVAELETGVIRFVTHHQLSDQFFQDFENAISTFTS